MKTLPIASLQEVLEKFIQAESGNVPDLELEAQTEDYYLVLNKTVGARYLVQTHKDFDLFGFMSMKADFPDADVYFFVGPTFIFAYFSSLKADFNAGTEWCINAADKTHKWASAFLLFHRLGGIIYNMAGESGWQLVDKDIKE